MPFYNVYSYLITSVTGKAFIGIKSDGETIHMPIDIAMSNPQLVQQRFRQHGVHLIGKDGEKAVIEGMRQPDDAPAITLLDQLGWNGNYFVRPNGEVFGSAKDEVVAVVPDFQADICVSSGTLAEWQNTVASAIASDCIPALTMLVQFVAPLMALVNVPGILAFEIVEASGRSIGCLPHLMLSVTGGMGSRAGQRYAVTYGDLLAEPYDTLAVRTDSPMVIDGHAMYMLGQSSSKRLEAVKVLMNLERQGPNSAYVLTGRDALIDLTDEDQGLDRILAERLITITLNPVRKYGVFDHRDRNHGGIGNRSLELAKAASLANGTAMPAYLAGLTRALAQDKLGVRRTIETHVDRFFAHIDIDLDDKLAVRTAKSFGLLYAAGRLAQSYGVLPSTWHCGRLMKKAYDLQRSVVPGRRNFDNELLDLEDAPGTVTIDRQKDRPSPKLINEASVFLLINGGSRQIAIRQDAIQSVIRDWSRRRTKSEVQVRMIRDGQHTTAKRTLIRGEKAERLFCFRLPRRVS